MGYPNLGLLTRLVLQGEKRGTGDHTGAAPLFPFGQRQLQHLQASVEGDPFDKVTKRDWRGFPGGAVVENLPANAGDTGSSPGLGRSHMPWSD